MKDRKLNGYKVIYLPSHPRSMKSKNWNGYIYEHIVLAEKIIGRNLKENEEVHHMDLDRTNNHPSNLLILDKSQHTKLHNFLEHGSKRYKECLICKKETDYDYCSQKCTQFSRRKIINRPSKKELLKLLETKSYLAVGQIFNVSDNTIRKWLKVI